ncbi:MAG TPA: beta-propeller domain-containing protein, partial [Polyangiales bacterium]|nr:beta-propeller domain-containing protein [Polyangiales bacterium]
MDMRITPHLAAWVCSLAAVSCTSQVSEDEPTVSVRKGAQLVRMRNCDEAQQQLRSHALARMNAQLDRSVAAAREALANGCIGPQPVAATGTVTSSKASTGGKGGSGGAGGTGGTGVRTASSAPGMPTASGPVTPAAMTQATSTMTSGGSASSAMNPTSTADQTSTTNNQVAEVDEADFVKNDNKYVYAAMNGAFRILTAWPPEEADEIARVALPDGTPKKLLIHEDRALVYVSIPNANARINNPRVAAFAPRSECSYGYDCEFGGDGTATALMVFDISDRESPQIVRRLDMAGSLIAARRIGSVVHTVAVTPEIVFQGVNNTLGLDICDPWLTEEQIDLAAASQRARNTRIINEIELPQISPSVREGDRDYGTEVCDSMYFDDEIAAGTAYTSLVAIDLAKQTDPGIATVVSKAGAVYASDQALYMAVPETSSGTLTLAPGAGRTPENSIVHKFRVGNDVDDVAYLASGTVKGSVLNQFSMDEHKGHLRIATTLGKVPNPDVYSALSVLEQDGMDLEVVGQVDKIAPSEDIRSVRFDGDRGFIVTFKKTDPLYMFDLSKPEEPRITGELKIPGFSTYMHMLDDTHLLSIGYDAEDHDSFAFFSGVLL